MKTNTFLVHLFVVSAFVLCGSSGVERVSVSVMEGDSVTLNTGVNRNSTENIKWYFNNIRIAQINGDQSFICTDVQCDNGTERFRDRLKLDHQTGSLTIMNITITDEGEYELQMIINSNSEKIFSVSVHGSSGEERVSVSVMEEDSVTLNTGVNRNSTENIKWCFNDILITLINGNLSKICTDVQCNKGTERFRDRLKLDHQTGSLTIMNITNTDEGDYKLQINSSSSFSITRVKIFSVSVHERDEVKKLSVKEGESVTLDPGVIKTPNDVMKWYFNDTLIAEITGDQSKICTDDQCDERFRDRLKLDHQTGSLNIMKTTNTDSGDYELQMIINSSSFSITRVKRFSVSVTGLSAGAIAGIVVGVLLVFVVVAVVVGVIYCRRRRSEKDVKENRPALLNAVRSMKAELKRSESIPISSGFIRALILQFAKSLKR